MMRNKRSWSFGDLGIRIALLGFAALLLMALQQSGNLVSIQSLITQLTSPAQIGTTSLTESVTDLVAFGSEIRSIRQRNSELEKINADLTADNLRLLEIERENERLRRLLDFAEVQPGLELRGAQIVARIIGQESNNFLDFFMLDLGQTHGIEEGMPVVTEQGFVGRISEVTDTTSKVLLVTDSNSSVSSLLQNSRLNGVIRGNPDGNLLMDYIPQGGIFSVGEFVSTSGLGGKFPKGLTIGQVVEIRQRDIDVFQQAVVRPVVQFDQIELVMVVTNFEIIESLPELLAPGIEEIPEGTPEAADSEATPVSNIEGEVQPVEGE